MEDGEIVERMKLQRTDQCATLVFSVSISDYTHIYMYCAHSEHLTLFYMTVMQSGTTGMQTSAIMLSHDNVSSLK